MELNKKQIKVIHPRYILLPRKTMDDKKISLNLNTERNLHYHVKSQCKKIVAANVKRYLTETKQLTPLKQCTVTFQVFKPTKARLDRHNVFGVAAKYIYDAVVEMGLLIDDNDNYILEETLLQTVHDKENPRIEIIFREV